MSSKEVDKDRPVWPYTFVTNVRWREQYGPVWGRQKEIWCEMMLSFIEGEIISLRKNDCNNDTIEKIFLVIGFSDDSVSFLFAVIIPASSGGFHGDTLNISSLLWNIQIYQNIIKILPPAFLKWINGETKCFIKNILNFKQSKAPFLTFFLFYFFWKLFFPFSASFSTPPFN